MDTVKLNFEEGQEYHNDWGDTLRIDLAEKVKGEYKFYWSFRYERIDDVCHASGNMHALYADIKRGGFSQ